MPALRVIIVTQKVMLPHSRQVGCKCCYLVVNSSTMLMNLATPLWALRLDLHHGMWRSLDLVLIVCWILN